MNKVATGNCGTRYILYICLFAGITMPGMGYFKDDHLVALWFCGCGAFIFVLLYEIYRAHYKKGNEVFPKSIIGDIATLTTAYECFYAIIKKVSTGGRLLGTMDNTAGLALCLSLLFPLVLNQTIECKQGRKSIYIPVAVISVITIAATGCRTAIINLAITAIIFLQLKFKLFKSPKLIAGFIIVAITSVFIFSSYKQESTTGRWFILRNTIELIKERPVTGYSKEGGFKKVYMDKQAQYFKENGEDRYAILADEVRHPLNEFLYIWVDYGIGGVILFISALVFPIIIFYREKSFIGLCTVVTVLIFSLFSYPLQYPLPNIALFVCNAAAIITTIKRKKGFSITKTRNTATAVAILLLACAQMNLLRQFYYHSRWSEAAYRAARGENREMLPELEKLYPHFSQETFYLYNYMAELYFAGELDKALEVSEELHRYMSSYNLELLTGDILLESGNYNSAIVHYKNAGYMCPNRFAPLEGLYKCYKNTNDDYNRNAIAQIILNKKVKIPSGDVLRIKNECK